MVGTVQTLLAIFCWLVLTVLAGPSAMADDPIFPRDAALEPLFTRQVELESGLTEGPAVVPDGTIYFTDMPFGDDQGQIHRYDPATGQTTAFTLTSGKSNGLAYHPDGYLVSCDGAGGGGRRLVRWDLATGAGTTLVDSYDGHRLNSPNDLCIDSQGRIYFTDPRYQGDEPRELEHEAVYRVDRDGSVSEITHEVEKPNGIVLSPDENTLYVGDHNNDPINRGAMKVYAFGLDENGQVHGPRRTLVDFGKENGCDGITVDAEGRIYLTCRSLAKPGIMVISPSGEELAFVPTGPQNQSGEFEDWKGIPSNVEFGRGDDSHTLYVTIDKSLYRIRTNTTGFHHAFRKP